MTAISWIFGAIGLPAALALGVAVIFFSSVIPSISKWIWIAVLVALGAWGAAGHAQASIEARRAAKAAEQRDEVAEALKAKTNEFGEYVAQVGAAAAAEQQARQAREGAYRDRNQTLDHAAADRAAADRADAQRLLGGAVKLAARAAEDRRAIEAAAAAGNGAANTARARVYADLFESCRQDYAEMAGAAHRARGRGLECEARYDSARQMTGSGP